MRKPAKVSPLDLVTTKLHEERMGRLKLQLEAAQKQFDDAAQKQRAHIDTMRAKYKLTDADLVDADTGEIRRPELKP